MKKVLLGLTGSLLAGTAMAQLPVSTTPQNRKVVLEEFTGIHCTWCPDGHEVANNLKAAKPAGSIMLVNIHTGSFATPGAGEPDFRTAEGNAIAAIPGTNISGYPTGSINRHLFSGQPGFALSRGDWARYADTILAKPAYVNVALQGSLNVATRVLTVNVEAYYTASSPASTNNLTVMLLENNILGPQTGMDKNPTQMTADGQYIHGHALRKVLTPAATGEVISTTTAGTTVTRTYTYTVPAQYVNTAAEMGNLELVGFMAESNAEIINGAYGPITLTGFAHAKDAEMMSLTSETEVCAGKLNPSVKFYNNGSSTITSAVFSYNVNGGTAQTYTFNGSVAPATSKTISFPEMTFTPTASNTLNVSVTSVNGGNDDNAANNTKANPNILLTTKIATTANVTMNFYQDRYGSESSWKVFDEATNTVVAQDGPFPDLSGNGTQLRAKTFAINPSKCYKLVVYDAYGDGINSGFGAGKYELKSGSNVLITSNGVFGKSQSSTYKSAPTLGVLEVLASGGQLSVFPNPASDKATVAFSLEKSASVSLIVTDMTGRIMLQAQEKTYAAGRQNAEIKTAGLASGVYNITLEAGGQRYTGRLTVVK